MGASLSTNDVAVVQRVLRSLSYEAPSRTWTDGDIVRVTNPWAPARDANAHDQEESALAVVLLTDRVAIATFTSALTAAASEHHTTEICLFAGPEVTTGCIERLRAHDFGVGLDVYLLSTSRDIEPPPVARASALDHLTVPAATGEVQEVIEVLRKQLIDLSRNNALLNFSTTKDCIRIIREKPNALFRLLVKEGSALRLEPLWDSVAVDGDGPDLRLPGAAAPDLPEHTDLLLQTALTPKQLQSQAARTFEAFGRTMRHTGSNQLHLALGFLNWFESETSDVMNRAPLVLIPVTMQRKIEEVRERVLAGDSDFDPDEPGPQFRTVPRHVYDITYTGDEIRSNLSLELRTAELGQPLPALSSVEDGDVQAYLDLVSRWASGNPHDKRWAVEHRGVLALFEFAQAWIYADLGDKAWKSTEGGTVRDLFGAGNHQELDPISADQLEHSEAQRVIPLIERADPSQYEVLLHAMKGGSLVVEGPPGSGKSQTIANLIAACLAEHQSVLFLAAKETALSVVAKRLSNVGLGEFLLPIYANGKSSGTSLRDLKASLEQRALLDQSFSGTHEGGRAEEEASRHRTKLNGVARELKRVDDRTRSPTSELLWQAIKAWEAYSAHASTCSLEPHWLELGHKPWADGLQVSLAEAGEFVLSLKELKKQGRLHFDNPWKGLTASALAETQLPLLLQLTESLLASWKAWTTVPRLKGLADDPQASPKHFMEWWSACQRVALPDWKLGVLGTEATIIKDLGASTKAIDDFESLLSERSALLQRNACPADQIPPTARLTDLITSYEQLLARCGKWRIGVAQRSLVALQSDLTAIRETLVTLREPSSLIPELPADRLRDCTVADVRKWLAALQSVGRCDVRDWPRLRIELTDPEAQALAKQLESEIAFVATEETALRAVLDEACLPSDSKLNDIKAALRHWRWWSRWFGVAHAAMDAAHEFLRTTLPPSQAIDLITRYQQMQAKCRALEAPPRAKELFGELYAGRATSWERIERARQVVADMIAAVGIKNSTTLLRGDPPQVDHGRLEVLEAAIARLAAVLERHPVLASYGLVQLSALPWSRVLPALDAVLTDVDFLLQWYDRLPVASWREQPLSLLGDVLTITRKLSDVEARIQIHAASEVLGVHFAGSRTVPATVTSLRSFLSGVSALVEATPIPSACIALFQGNDWSAVVTGLQTWMGQAGSAAASAMATEQQLTALGCVPPYDYLRPSSLGSLSIADWTKAIEARLAAPQALKQWMELGQRLSAAKRFGMNPLLDHAVNARCDLDLLTVAYEATAYRDYCTAMLEGRDLTLESLTAHVVEERRREFVNADSQQGKAAAALVKARCMAWQAKDDGRSGMKVAEKRGSQLLRHIADKDAHVTVREVVDRAKGALMARKPCWLMSPGSVSQYLPKTPGLFDVLIVDEASQLRTAEVAPAALRAKRIIIFGDSKQMPPTLYGRRTASEVGDEYGTGESVLERAVKGMPSAELRWHYRSQHEDLIRYSKHCFYKKMIVFPTANPGNPELGLYHEFVGGYYVAHCNQREAERAVDVAREYMITEHRRHGLKEHSLGIIAMNAPQRDLIDDLLQEARSDDAELAEAMAKSEASTEPYFVTNLESVQGDERDHIIISCTYGPEAEGLSPSNQFGPIVVSGGERRLNVLFTRARRRMTVLASLHPHDITANSAGARHFRGFLEFARDRKITEQGARAADRAVNGFEASVVKALTAANYRVQCQIGVSGYFIDAAVEDPNCTGRFILGIECDGATYHSSRTARERDRLRQEVLETQGWHIYRVWSTDWFHDRVSAERRLLQAVEHRLRVVREEESKIVAAAKQAVVPPPSKEPEPDADAEELSDDDVAAAVTPARAQRTIPAFAPSDPAQGETPETVTAARVVAAIIAALQDRSYLKREALLKEVCRALNFQIRGVRRSQFSKRMWRLTRSLARKGITRIGGANSDCAALLSQRRGGTEGGQTRLAI